MRKQVRQYFRKSLCGMLSAAMIATSLIVPNMTVYAAPQDDEASVMTENEEELVEGTTGEEETGDENKDSGLEGDNGNVNDGSEEEGSSEIGDNADEADKENPDGEKEGNPDGDLADEEEVGEEEDLKSEVEKVDEEHAISVAAETAAEGYGTLQNGDLEDEDKNSGDVWKPDCWTFSGDGGQYTDGTNGQSGTNTSRFVSWWANDAGTLSLSQTIENIEPGVYVLAFETYGNYTTADNIKVNITNTSLEDEALGDGPEWTWREFETKAFGISSPDSGDQVDITITISGNRGAGETVKFDNFELTKLSYTLDQLKKLLEEANTCVEANYTAESWKTFAEKKNAAQTLVDGNSTDTDAITLAYAELKAAMDDLVSSGMTFYYYVGETDDEIGLYVWGSNISSAAENTDWNVWAGEGEKDTYKMSPVTGYTGWYSVPLTIASGGASSGFQVYKKADKGTNNNIFKCDNDDHSGIYGTLASGTKAAYAVKGDVCYEGEDATAILRNVTLYVYSEDVVPALHIEDKTGEKGLTKVDEDAGTISKIATSGADEWGNPVWNMSEVADAENWYQISFVAPGKLDFDNEKICGLYDYDETKEEDARYSYNNSFINGGGLTWGIDFTPVFSGKNYYYNGTFYASQDEVEAIVRSMLLERLQNLIKQAKEKKQEDYTSGWKEFAEALAAAEAVQKAVEEADSDETAPTNAEIRKACEDLQEAMDALVSASIVKSDIIVKQVALTDDFITGADISSYYALKESGVVFKDEEGNPLSDQGFFDYLYEGGMNWARIRIWNDPYNSSGKGYGGGNNDLEKAKIIGKWASNAGMKVLIDFHYSDFWADPAKQKAPKAWAGYSVDQKADAIYDFTLESLKELKGAGVNVGMVQVGNETNNGICGETNWDNMAKLFSAGSKAVREFDPECLVAVHFTNPQDKEYASIAKRWIEKGVDYDVFASSFYPFGHGDTTNLKEQLEQIVTNPEIGKRVMVAETSWPTTLIDGDGYGYVSRADVPADYASQDYGISVQGQADEMRDLIYMVNQINTAKPGSSLGVFYWEPAWISPYYIKDEEGNDIESLYKQNFDLWEKYGSGWASSYAAEYDPEDAGVWFGGSAMDNSSWFDFDGTALPTAKIYSLIRTGATSDKRIATVVSNITMEVGVGSEIDWPATVNAKYNNGDPEYLPVTWDADEKELVNSYKTGEYTVHGIASDDKTGTGDYKITLKIKVLRAKESNILENPSFETGAQTPWEVQKRAGHGESETDAPVKISDETPHEGKQELHFWSSVDLDITVSQTVKPEAGTYTFGGYVQGGGADIEDVQYAYVTVRDKDKKQKSTQKVSFALNGWQNWANPEITGISVADGDEIEVGLIIKSTKYGAWGSIDDLYLYGMHTVSIDDKIEHGSVTANVVKANGGESVILTVAAENGYYPETLTVFGAKVLESTLASKNGEVKYEEAAEGSTVNRAVLTYAAQSAEEKSETFTMPNGNVTVSATFASVFEEGKKIQLDAKEDGKYLVQVNGSDQDQPITDQYHTGKNVTPAVELSYKGYKLSTKDDYTITYADNKAVGTAKIKLTAKSTSKLFEGTREISFNIVADTRKEFKNLKVTFKNPDKGDGSTPAKSTYYLGKQKELTPEIVLKDSTGNVISNPGDKPVYNVFYHNNKKLGKATVVVLPTDDGLEIYKEGSLTTTFTIAKCPVNYGKVSVNIAQPNQYYTGKKVEPAVTVKLTYTDNNGAEKTTTLTKGTDYTVAYSNNTNATKMDTDGNPIPKNLASIKITGKGNFTGTRTTEDVKTDGKAGDKKLTFVIKPRSITNATITAADLVQSNSGAVPKLTVKDGTKVLASSQYVITKIVKKGATQSEDKDVYTYNQTEKDKNKATTGKLKLTEEGRYEVTVAGKTTGNYNGEKTAQFDVKGKEYLISNAKITISGKFYFTGKRIELDSTGNSPELKVVAGSGQNAKTLEVGKDYTVAYENNINAGKATVTITGKGDYVGKKTAGFTIGKRTLADEKAIKTDKDKLTKGAIQIPKLSEKNIATKLDGTWTPDTAGNLINKDKTNEKGKLAIPYTGYTLNPEITFSAKNSKEATEASPFVHELSSGDYTVSYSIGKWVETKDGTGKVTKTAPVTATVKGKGNYSGSVKIPNLFTLTAQDLTQFNIKVNPISYNGGKALKPSVTFSKDGKVVDLKAGTAYTVTYKNNKLATLLGLAADKNPKVTVKVKGNGWITNKSDTTTTQREIDFSIDQQEIVKTDVADIAIQTYKGKALTPAVTVKVNGKKLKAGKDYTVTYSNNVKRTSSSTTIGTVTITGKGNYFTRNPITKTFVIK